MSEHIEDDGYDAKLPYTNRRRHGWNYRLVSYPDTEPGKREGQRLLEIRRVEYDNRDLGDGDAQFGHVSHIETRKWTALASRFGSVEEVLVDLERRKAAVDRPVIIYAEWREHRKYMREWYAKQTEKDTSETSTHEPGASAF